MYGSDPGPRRYGPLHSHVPHERRDLFYWTLIFPGYAILWWRAYFGTNALRSRQASRAVYNRPAVIVTSLGMWLAVLCAAAMLLLGAIASAVHRDPAPPWNGGAPSQSGRPLGGGIGGPAQVPPR